ncbi:alpha/beta hydrolase [Cellulomonas sp.]|uniref:alpha/beta hydrolase n=1 Tax=Cellulomonas sp. TaxID=40001 RepID=UPI00281178DF|nr:alpha/beta hydrolase [Cellulomonas sp.]
MSDDAVGPAETDDVLGPGWVARTLPLRPDALSRRGAPDPVATLVHRRPDDAAAPAGTPATPPSADLAPPRPRTAVLYLHGFVDYFFHPHVADALARAGYDLWALDLRDYGRSIRPGRPANEITDLATYTEEIDTAVRLLRGSHDRLVVLAHSTGGLTAALWAHARRGRGLVDALVLNSPWLELRGTTFERTVLTGAIDVVGRVAPRLVVSRTARHYGEALHAATGGPWDYDLAWKPHTFEARAGFVRAVRRGHARVARGLAVDCPVLVLASDAAGPDDRWHDALLTTDSVLDPAQIAARAPLLGPDVTFVQVPGGAHDLALSPAPARERYLDEVLRFLEERLGDA